MYPLSINGITIYPIVQEKKTWESAQDFSVSFTYPSNQLLTLVDTIFWELEYYY